MQKIFPACLLVLVLFWSSISLADVIYLKNGRKIVAEITREGAKQIFYELGEGEIAIPRSLVDHIEKSPTEASRTSESTRSIRPRDLPLLLPPEVKGPSK